MKRLLLTTAALLASTPALAGSLSDPIVTRSVARPVAAECTIWFGLPCHVETGYTHSGGGGLRIVGQSPAPTQIVTPPENPECEEPEKPSKPEKPKKPKSNPDKPKKPKKNASENNGKGGNDGKGGKPRDGSKKPRK